MVWSFLAESKFLSARSSYNRRASLGRSARDPLCFQLGCTCSGLLFPLLFPQFFYGEQSPCLTKGLASAAFTETSHSVSGFRTGHDRGGPIISEGNSCENGVGR